MESAVIAHCLEIGEGDPYVGTGAVPPAPPAIRISHFHFQRLAADGKFEPPSLGMSYADTLSVALSEMDIDSGVILDGV